MLRNPVSVRIMAEEYARLKPCTEEERVARIATMLQNLQAAQTRNQLFCEATTVTWERLRTPTTI